MHLSGVSCVYPYLPPLAAWLSLRTLMTIDFHFHLYMPKRDEITGGFGCDDVNTLFIRTID